MRAPESSEAPSVTREPQHENRLHRQTTTTHTWRKTDVCLDLRHRRRKGWTAVISGHQVTVVPSGLAGWLAASPRFLPPEFVRWLEGEQ